MTASVAWVGAVLFLLGALAVCYTFAGYPLLLALAGMVRRSDRPGVGEGRGIRDQSPRISITVPVYNEVHQIEKLLKSLVALDYPEECRQILIVSDGSDDGTDEVVRRWAERGVELLVVQERRGKGAAENVARPHLTGEIVVNTDASIRIRPDALRPLVRPFADPTVGVVSGRDVSVSRQEGNADTGEGGYVGYEMMVRDLETRVGGIVGASGCFYATRGELHEVEVSPELSRDFAAALVAREKGYRAISVPEAVCYVPRTASLGREYRRKVRTVARGMSTLWAWRHLLNPLRHPGFAWKLFSHKVCRWSLPVAALVGLLGLGLMAVEWTWAAWGLAVAGGILGVATVGWALSVRGYSLPRPVSVLAFLLASNVAVVHAAARALGRGSERLWEPTRRELASGPGS